MIERGPQSEKTMSIIETNGVSPPKLIFSSGVFRSDLVSCETKQSIPRYINPERLLESMQIVSQRQRSGDDSKEDTSQPATPLIEH